MRLWVPGEEPAEAVLAPARKLAVLTVLIMGRRSAGRDWLESWHRAAAAAQRREH